MAKVCGHQVREIVTHPADGHASAMEYEVCAQCGAAPLTLPRVPRGK